MYSIVEFADGDFYELVPRTWLVKNTCLWPDFLDYSDISKLIAEQKMPESNWKQCPVSILEEAETFIEGRAKLKRMLTGDIDIDSSESSLDSSDYKMVEENLDSNDGVLNIRIFTDMGVQTDCCNFSDQIHANVSTPKLYRPRKSKYMNLLMVNEVESCNRFQKRCCAEQSDKFQTILEELQEIRSSLQKQTEQLDMLSQQVYPLRDEEKELDIIKSLLPMKTLEDVSTLEAFLKNPKFKFALKGNLKKICGQTPGESTRKVLKSLFSDDLASQFSWFGKSKQRSFLNLRVTQIILDIICEHHQIDCVVIETAIQVWLKYTNTRILYRRRHKEE